MSQLSFLDKSTTKKGTYAQDILRPIIEDRNLHPYWPDDNSGAHPFDFMGLDKGWRRIVAGDSKAKAARTHYPDTGIDKRHYEKYKRLAVRHRLLFWLLFVDEYKKEVYGNFLHILDKPRKIYWNGQRIMYPAEMYNIIYFPLEYMKHVADLTDEQAATLKAMSTRNETYEYPSEIIYARLGVALAPDSHLPKQQSLFT